MTQHYVLYYDDKTPLNLTLYKTKERALHAINQQRRGGFDNAINVAITRNGLLWDVVDGEKVELSKGIFTNEAFDNFTAQIALHYRIYCQRGYGWGYSADQLESNIDKDMIQ